MMLFLDYSPDLTSLDRTIYNYVSSHAEQVINMKVRELAKHTHTSPTSILRFCQKFECTGFSEFRIKLEIYLREKDSLDVNPIDSTAIVDFVHRTTHPIYLEKIHAAAALLKTKELILFVGSGASNIMASYGTLYFSSIFNIALRIEDLINYPIDYLSKELSEKICVIALSVSGETTEVINCLNHLNLSHSSIISITNSADCTVADLSDVNIPYYISKEYNKDANITSQIPALYTIEYLAKEVRRLKEKS